MPVTDISEAMKNNKSLFTLQTNLDNLNVMEEIYEAVTSLTST